MNTQLIHNQYGLQGVPAPVVAPVKAPAPKKQVNMKKRVRATQRKAKFVGFLYLLGAIALLAAACLPLVEVKANGENAAWKLSVLTFWKPFLAIDFKAINLGIIQTLAIPVIYGLLLIVLFVNVIRCLGKLKWLYKKKASRTFGFNRNAFAMEDMGRIFSDSFCAVALATFAICLFGAKYLYVAHIAAAAAIFLHLFCGLIGGTVSLFTAQVGVEEEKRKYGSFGPFLRNIIQIAATVAFAIFFAKKTTFIATLLSLTKEGGIQALLGDMPKLIVTALELVTFLCWIVLLKHATGVSEFDRDGKEAAGRKNFWVFSLFAFLLTAGIVVVEYMMSGVQWKDNMVGIYIVAIAFGAFLLDVCLSGLPRLKKQYRPEKPVVEAAPTQYYTQQQPASRVPLQCISSPCFVNQGGQQYMVMPMSSNAAAANETPAVEYYFVD
jgi:hypothetical protein